MTDPSDAGSGGVVPVREAAPETASALDPLRDELDELIARHELAARHLAYLLNRSLLERLLFGRDGKPYRMLREVFFHRNGKPRGMFKKWLLLRNGQPRPMFQFWMTSTEYRALPMALRLSPSAPRRPFPDGTLELSPRTGQFVARLGSAGGRDARK